MRRNGYESYHGRSRGRNALKVLIGVLLVLLVLSVAALFFLEPYIHYSADGVRVELPFFGGGQTEPDPPAGTVPIQITTPEPTPSPTPEPEVDFRGVQLPAAALTDGTAQTQLEANRGTAAIFSMKEADGTLVPRLSRRRAQRAALDAMLSGLRPGQIIPAVVTHLEPFGAFVDIGCGVPSMIGIENISISRIPHPDQRFRVGQSIYAVVLDLEPGLGRIYLTHRELLGTWAENAARFQAGMTVPGVVRGLKDYGAFVELTPNLSGLAERKDGLAEGQRISVYIKAILPQRMKIKLLAIDTLPPLAAPPPLEYFLTEGHIEKWKYAPEGCVKVGAETIFS